MPVSAAHFAAWLPGYVRLIGSERAAEIFRRTPGRRERRKRQDAPSHAPLLLTLGFIAAGLLLARALGWLASAAMRGRPETTRFWVRQGAQLLTALLLVVGLTSIWFDDPVRLATALGLISAGLAFALQSSG